MKRTLILLGVVGVCALVVPGALAGKAHNFTSTVTAHRDQSPAVDFIKGKVKSVKRGCRVHRTLKLLRDEFYTGDYVVYESSIRTNGHGLWNYDPPLPIPNGNYRAMATGKTISAGNCRSAKSKAVFVD